MKSKITFYQSFCVIFLIWVWFVALCLVVPFQFVCWWIVCFWICQFWLCLVVLGLWWGACMLVVRVVIGFWLGLVFWGWSQFDASFCIVELCWVVFVLQVLFVLFKVISLFFLVLLTFSCRQPIAFGVVWTSTQRFALQISTPEFDSHDSSAT